FFSWISTFSNCCLQTDLIWDTGGIRPSLTQNHERSRRECDFRRDQAMLEVYSMDRAIATAPGIQSRATGQEHMSISGWSYP
ncbi:MAG: hypothetical protein J5861_06650, partial [Desulfovibrio sp.]|nr:hypothetical protein [Desulfovibrio sp.]